jgi:hypothetical protein
VSVVIAGLVTFQTLATDGISVADDASIAVAVLTAVGVYLLPNVPATLNWTKTAVAFLLAGAQAAVQVAANGTITGAGWLTVGIAALGVLAVYAAPNRPALTRPAAV